MKIIHDNTYIYIHMYIYMHTSQEDFRLPVDSPRNNKGHSRASDGRVVVQAINLCFSSSWYMGISYLMGGSLMNGWFTMENPNLKWMIGATFT